MPRGIFVPANQERALESRERQGLVSYQSAVGGSIEAVDLPEAGATLFVNEEAWVKLLAVNARATLLWWLWEPAARKEQSLLLGDAVVVGRPDRSGDATDVPEELAALLLHPGEFGIEIFVRRFSAWRNSHEVFPSWYQAAEWGMNLLKFRGTADRVRVTRLAGGEYPGNRAGAVTNERRPSAG